ncbi:hypothetical protein ACHQM5_024497 [Ranunculus cassubicifolius]
MAGAASDDDDERSLDHLPSALLASIISKLDLSSICSIASTCKTFNSSASHVLSFLPNFHLLDVAPSVDLLKPLLPPNPYLRSLKIDCSRLNDSSINHLIQPSLHDIFLLNCEDFTGELMSAIGKHCKDLRSLYLGSLAEKRMHGIYRSDLEQLLGGCSLLESLSLMFNVSVDPSYIAQVWLMTSTHLTTLEIGYVPSETVIESLSPTSEESPHPLPHMRPSVFPSIQKLCLSVNYITDALVDTISKCLISLTHLDLRDAPMTEPTVLLDLTNSGLQQINQTGKLKHLSLVRSQEYLQTSFRRVNDLGIMLMADKCSHMESISLGGFCRVTDTGVRAILHQCSTLQKLKLCHGTQLTDLVFHDISATSLALTSVSLRWCSLLTDHAIVHLACNMDLRVLDLRVCRNIGDEGLKAIGSLRKLLILLLDGSDITDTGLSYLGKRVMTSLVSLSIRGCRRLTDKCIGSIFNGTCGRALQNLDLSNIPNLTDNGILLLAKSKATISELRLRECPRIGDISVMALASMQLDDGGWHGSRLRLLDLYECKGITSLSFRWFKKPYFPRLRWFGLTGSVNRDLVDALARSRPFLHLLLRGEELGSRCCDSLDGLEYREYEEFDELEQWMDEGEQGDFDYDEMEEGEENEFEGMEV